VKDSLEKDEFYIWLKAYGAEDKYPQELLQNFIRGVNVLGVDVYRSSLWLPTAHPELWGTQVVWSADDGVMVYRREHSITSTATYMNTPGEAVHRTRKAMRWSLDAPEETLPFPLLKEIQAEGGSDYLIVPFQTDHTHEQPWITFATRRVGGFSLLEINTLQELCIALSWKARVCMAELAVQSLLGVYLGPNAAQRVLSGEFKRGTGQELNAVIWFCDLRDFTQLSNSLSAKELVVVLDHFFECMAGPIEEAGGEILKFIGDSILAVFPLTQNTQALCLKVKQAAEKALDNLEYEQDFKQGELKAGIALHLGEMMFGNIGGRSRLDFTVIGSSVNKAARVEGLCKVLAPLLMTEDFAQQINSNDLTYVGEKTLRGIEQSCKLFTVKKYLGTFI